MYDKRLSPSDNDILRWMDAAVLALAPSVFAEVDALNIDLKAAAELTYERASVLFDQREEFIAALAKS